MAKFLSEDRRSRLIAAVEGGMSRRGAADRFGVSVVSAIRWFREWREPVRCASSPRATIRVYVEQVLAPTLTCGDVVVMDNLPDHEFDTSTNPALRAPIRPK